MSNFSKIANLEFLKLVFKATNSTTRSISTIEWICLCNLTKIHSRDSRIDQSRLWSWTRTSKKYDYGHRFTQEEWNVVPSWYTYTPSLSLSRVLAYSKILELGILSPFKSLRKYSLKEDRIFCTCWEWHALSLKPTSPDGNNDRLRRFSRASGSTGYKEI